ncbi:MAG: hypothetical protein R3F61_08575 [Myxococcota bacterium]
MSSVLVALAIGSGAAWAGCETPTTNEDVIVALEKAVARYEAVDVEGFTEAVTAIDAATTCLGESVTRSNAAAMHRMHGLAAFLERDEAASRQSFAAARTIEPAYTFPTAVVPEGNPVLEQYIAIDPAAGAKVTLPFPSDGTVKLDGSSRLERNPRLPVLFQRIDASGAVTQTVLVAGGAETPTYPAGKEPQEKKGPSGPNLPLLAAGVGTVAVAGGVYGGAWATNRAFYKERDGDRDEERLTSLRSTANTLVITSATLSVVGIGLGGTSFALSGRF